MAAIHLQHPQPRARAPSGVAGSEKPLSSSALSAAEGRDMKALPQNRYPLETQKLQFYIQQQFAQQKGERGKETSCLFRLT